MALLASLGTSMSSHAGVRGAASTENAVSFDWTEAELRQALGSVQTNRVVAQTHIPVGERLFYWGSHAKIAVLSLKTAPDQSRYPVILDEAVRIFNAAMQPYGLSGRAEADLPKANIVIIVVPRPYSMARAEFQRFFAALVEDDGFTEDLIERSERQGDTCFGFVKLLRFADGAKSGQAVWFIDDAAQERERMHCVSLGMMAAFGVTGRVSGKPNSVLDNSGTYTRFGATDLSLIHRIYRHQRADGIDRSELLEKLLGAK